MGVFVELHIPTHPFHSSSTQSHWFKKTKKNKTDVFHKTLNILRCSRNQGNKSQHYTVGRSQMKLWYYWYVSSYTGQPGFQTTRGLLLTSTSGTWRRWGSWIWAELKKNPQKRFAILGSDVAAEQLAQNRSGSVRRGVKVYAWVETVAFFLSLSHFWGLLLLCFYKAPVALGKSWGRAAAPLISHMLLTGRKTAPCADTPCVCVRALEMRAAVSLYRTFN